MYETLKIFQIYACGGSDPLLHLAHVSDQWCVEWYVGILVIMDNAVDEDVAELSHISPQQDGSCPSVSAHSGNYISLGRSCAPCLSVICGSTSDSVACCPSAFW